MAEIFLSYDHDDRSRVAKLVAALELSGWQVWWDHRILPGQTWDETIKDALDHARCVVVVWSRNSVKSEWVRIEANNGHERRILVPAMLEAVSLPLAFQLVQAAPLTDWDGTADHPGFQVLAAGIRAVLAPRAAAVTSSIPATADPTEPRALDAAIGHHLPVHTPAHLITMIRRADSAGLKAILETDASWDLKPEDLASRPFDLTFPADAAGRRLPATLTLHINAPDFDPPSQQKKVRVAPGRDSAVFDFLLSPRRAGDLAVHVEAYEGDVCLVSRVLKPEAVEGESVEVGRLVVSTPLNVTASMAATVGGKERLSRVGHWTPPATTPDPPPARTREEPSMPAPQPAPVSKSRTWMKFGAAAALVVLCVPAVWYSTRPGMNGKAELPSSTAPPPKDVPVKPAPVQARVMIEPRNAELIIDGEECPRPCVLSLTPGRVEIKASARGVDPLLHTVVVPPGRPVVILVNLKKGTVRVTHP